MLVKLELDLINWDGLCPLTRHESAKEDVSHTQHSPCLVNTTLVALATVVAVYKPYKRYLNSIPPSIPRSYT
jgi:hypothetical protein